MRSMYGPVHERPGRPKGSQNRSSKAIREALEDLVTMSLPKMKQWIEDIAAESPKEAMRLILDMSEYVLPKLARVELTGDEDNPIHVIDSTDIKYEILKALPEHELKRILASYNTGGHIARIEAQEIPQD